MSIYYCIGALAGIIEITCTYPMEYIKYVIMLEKKKQGILSVAKDTFSRHGPLGFYRGFSCNFIFIIPKNSVRFYTF